MSDPVVKGGILSTLSSFAPSDLVRPRNLFIWLPVVILTYMVSQVCYNLFFHPLRKYPGPKTWAACRVPWLYNQLNGNLHEAVLKLHEQYGDIVRIGPKELAYTSGAAWRQIYGHRREEMDKDYRGSGLTHLGGTHSISTAPQEMHRRVRRCMTSAFSEKALRDQEDVLHIYVDRFIDRLSEKSIEGPQDMVSWYNWCTFDVMGDLSFGEDFGCLKSTNYHTWISTVFASMHLITWIQACVTYHILPLLFIITPRRHIRASRIRDEISYEKTERRIEKNDIERKDFMSHILQHYHAKEISREEIHRNSVILVIAGSETTATSLAGLTYSILRTPRVYKRLVNEIRSKAKSYEEITGLKTNTMPYMRAVIEEALRLYPPVPVAFPRVVPGLGEEIEGKWVPGGTTVGVHQYSANRYHKNFYKSLEFMPERWLSEDVHMDDDDDDQHPKRELFVNDQRDAVQPFSVGPRNCIGRNLAYTEMKVILAKLLWTFDLELAPETNHDHWFSEQKTFLLWDKNAMKVILKKRFA